MSKTQKQLSEQKHKMVHRYLIKNFPGCSLKYDGVEGFDHQIKFEDSIMVLETKTCKKIIRAGIDRNKYKNRRVLFEKIKLGQFKFDQNGFYPYTKSQHGDLVEKEGWYIFVVGSRIVSGAPAKDIELIINGKWKTKRISWAHILNRCSPDWLTNLKMEVYGVRK